MRVKSADVEPHPQDNIVRMTKAWLVTCPVKSASVSVDVERLFERRPVQIPVSFTECFIVSIHTLRLFISCQGFGRLEFQLYNSAKAIFSWLRRIPTFLPVSFSRLCTLLDLLLLWLDVNHSICVRVLAVWALTVAGDLQRTDTFVCKKNIYSRKHLTLWFTKY